jgi:sortase A
LLQWSERALWLGGIFGLAYALSGWMQAGAFQAYQGWLFDRGALRSDSAASAGSPQLHSVLGRIEIPRLDVSVMIVEGVDERALLLGAGHVPGTPLPDDDPGNVAIAGHRDTFFRPLHGIRKGDRIVLTTPAGSSDYIVESTQVAQPTDTELLDDTREPILTLITCYPFSYVGAAPERFVIRARRIGPA